MRRDVYQGIADPTRRKILSMVSRRSMNVNSVTANFTISRTAVYKHIKILTECGLIVLKKNGRERFCEARLEKLGEVSAWIMQYRQQWGSRLNKLEIYLKEIRIQKKKSGKTKMMKK